MIKKCIAFLIVFGLIFSIYPFQNASGETSSPIRVFMYGSKVNFQTPPILKNNLTFVEMRPVFKMAGIQLHWDQRTKTVTGIKGENTFKLTLGKKTAYINGKPVQLKESPFVKNNYTFVPLRFITEATNHKVDWRGSFNLIHIHNNLQFLEEKAFMKEHLNEEMLNSLREGKFPDCPIKLTNNNLGELLDIASTPKIFFPGVPNGHSPEMWMYGDYLVEFGESEDSFDEIHVNPTRASFTMDEVIDALGPAENTFYDDLWSTHVLAYYEGAFMYEFRSNDGEKLDEIILKRIDD